MYTYNYQIGCSVEANTTLQSNYTFRIRIKKDMAFSLRFTCLQKTWQDVLVQFANFIVSF